MKRILLSFIVIAAVACNSQENSEQNNEAEEVAVVENEVKAEDAFLGESFDLNAVTELGDLVSKMDASDSVEAVVQVEVVEVCEKKGCWMIVDLPNGESMRVTFKDYGFFMPKDLAGKSVKMNGVAKIEETDVETLKHFAEDGGKSEEEIALITEAEMNYKFVASGVKLID